MGKTTWLLAVGLLGASACAQTLTDWPTHHYNYQRTGFSAVPSTADQGVNLRYYYRLVSSDPDHPIESFGSPVAFVDGNSQLQGVFGAIVPTRYNNPDWDGTPNTEQYLWLNLGRLYYVPVVPGFHDLPGWSFTTGDDTADGLHETFPIYSTPAISTFTNGTLTQPWIILACGNAENPAGKNLRGGVLYCLDSTNGSKRWEFNLNSGPRFSSPLIRKVSNTETYVYVGTLDGTVYRVDANTTDDNDRKNSAKSVQLDGAVDSAPSMNLSGDRIFVSTLAGSVYSLSADLKILEQFTDTTPGAIYGSPAFSQSVGNAERLYVASTNGKVYCLDPGDMSKIWEKDLGSPMRCTPAVAAGPGAGATSVYVGTDDGRVVALDGETGQIISQFSVRGSVRGSVSVYNMNGEIRFWIGTGSKLLWQLGWVFSGGAWQIVSYKAFTSSGSFFNQNPALPQNWALAVADNGRLLGYTLGAPISEPPDEQTGIYEPSPNVVQPMVDIFTEQDYNNLTSGSTSFPTPLPVDKRTFEWGDTLYIIAWGLDGANCGDGLKPVTFQVQGPGQVVFEVPNVTPFVINSLDPATTAAKTTIQLNPKTRGGLLTPGSSFTISCLQQSLTETAYQEDGGTGTYWDGFQLTAQFCDDYNNDFNGLKSRIRRIPNTNAFAPFTINNPLDIWDQYLRDDKISNPPGSNGSKGQGMLLRPAEPLEHGRSSEPLTINLVDRSNMYLLNSSIDTVRIQVGDYLWFGGAKAMVMPFPQGTAYIKEDPPADRKPWDLNIIFQQPFNPSLDYTDIASKNSVFRTQTGDPRFIPVQLKPKDSNGIMQPTPMEGIIRVPRFQAANIDDPATGGGYQTIVTLWVDSNGNGRPDIPGAGDADAKGRYEAFRQFRMTFNVAVDKRFVILEDVVDIGKVPHSYRSYLDATPPNDHTGPFKRAYSVRNDGNVNLLNLCIPAYDLNRRPVMPTAFNSDTVDWRTPLINRNLRSTLRRYIEQRNFFYFEDDARFKGPFTLHKARVADGVPTVLNVPDWNDPDPNNQPPDELKNNKPYLTVDIPLGTPVGTYTLPFYVSERTLTDLNGHVLSETFSQNASTVKVTVGAAQMTDGKSGGSKTQIDKDVPRQDRRPESGPTAYRVFSSNRNAYTDLRIIFPSARGSQDIGPNANYFLFSSRAEYDANARRFVLRGNTGNEYWWDPTGQPFTQDDIGIKNPEIVRYLNPAIADDTDLITQRATQRHMYWERVAEKFNPDTGRNEREWQLFYGLVDRNTGLPETGSISPITGPENLRTEKHRPRGLAFRQGVNKWYLAAYQAGDSGTIAPYFVVNANSPTDPEFWTEPRRIPVPQGILGVSDPWPMHRDRTYFDANNPNGIDIVFSLQSKSKDDGDIVLGRYAFEVDNTPNLTPPSGRLALIRPDRLPDGSPNDALNRTDFGPASPLFSRLDGNGNDQQGEVLKKVLRQGETIYFARGLDWRSGRGNNRDNPRIWMIRADGSRLDFVNGPYDDRDPNTGVLFYYPKNTAYTVRVDPVSGTVRIETGDPLSWPLPQPNDQVRASYVPRALRLTDTAAADTAPQMFLEALPATDRNLPYYPTRMWLLWRRHTLDYGGAISYKTYRLGIDLAAECRARGLDPRVLLDSNGAIRDLVTGSRGPYFFDWINGRVYFSLLDEGNNNILVQHFYNDGNDSVMLGDSTPGRDRPDKLKVQWLEEVGDTLVPMNETFTESQFWAFKDPGMNGSLVNDYDNRVWLFWTRSTSRVNDPLGSLENNYNLFYQTISPRFSTKEAPEVFFAPNPLLP